MVKKTQAATPVIVLSLEQLREHVKGRAEQHGLPHLVQTLGVDKSTLSRFINGKVVAPPPKLALALKLTPDIRYIMPKPQA